MATVKIYHARSNEDGKTDHGIPGDQTGREIMLDDFYVKNWLYYIECLDDDMAARAVAFAKQIADNPNFGYAQDARWTAFNSIMANGRKVAGAKGDLDCASYIITLYILAGLNITASGYTGNLKSKFEATGKFKVYTDDAHVGGCAYAKKGALYVRPKTEEEGGHVFIVATNGPNVIAQAVQVREKPYVEIIGNCNIRTGASTDYPSVATARKGQTYSYKGTDSVSGWHQILYKDKIMFVSGKKTLTRVVT